MRSIAAAVEAPVVTVSSTTRQRSPGSTGPSTQRCRPCSFRSLRTKKPSRPSPPGTAIAAQASGIAAITGSADRDGPGIGRGGSDQRAGGAKAWWAKQGAASIDVVVGLGAA